MRKLSRCAAVVASLISLHAIAAHAGITSLTVDPPLPSSHDAVHLTVSGQGPLCSLLLIATMPDPGTILLRLTPCPVDPPPPDVPFAQTVTVGPLPEGTYSVEVEGGSFTAPLFVSDLQPLRLVNSLFFVKQRFEASLTWHTAIASGVGVSEAVTDNSGYFWFFDPSNPELLVKVIDGRAVNGHFWVFLGGLSDVAYTLTLTDRATDKVRTYTNTPGAVTSRADTSSF
jgi:hypothetical protein